MDQSLPLFSREAENVLAFLTHPLMAAHLMEMGMVITGDYERPTKVKLEIDNSEDGYVALTDAEKIFINVDNEIMRSMPTPFLKYSVLVGIHAHEKHHIYSDFIMLTEYRDKFTAGRLFPRVPEVKTKADRRNLADLRKVLQDGDATTRHIIQQNAMFIQNCIEDYFVNTLACERCPGTIRFGIMLSLARQAMLMISVQKQFENGYSPMSILLNLILQYTYFGAYNNLGQCSGELVDTFEGIKPLIDEACSALVPRDRFEYANKILVRTWPFLRQEIEGVQQQEEKGQTSQEAQNAFDYQKQKEVPGCYEQSHASPLADGRSTPEPMPAPSDDLGESATTGELPNDSGEERKAATLSAETQQMQEVLSVMDVAAANAPANGAPPDTYDGLFKQFGINSAFAEFTQIESEVEKSREMTEREHEILATLLEQAEQIQLGANHAGISLEIHRDIEVRPEAHTAYKNMLPELRKTVESLNAVIPDILKEDGDALLKGQYAGALLDVERLYYPIGGIFCQEIEDRQDIDAAVSFIVDVSASMDNARVKAARLAVLAVYQFCRGLDIPVSAWGHSKPKGKKVNIYSYAEFGSVDGYDPQRIADMQCRGCNRDGPAITFACERLLRRKEETKILVLTTDGLPNDGAYRGAVAENDIRAIVRKYTDLGIVFIAAAIGSDTKRMERIYGPAFMDMTNLSQLPANLVKALSNALLSSD